MTTVPADSLSEPKETSSVWKVLLPYVLAIVAQGPMLLLYFRQLWGRPHYQPFGFAILATAVLAFMRWPTGKTVPFHRSIGSDVLLVIGFGFAFLGMLFVEPWFAALSVMLIVTSLLARTIDNETGKSLWPCALPLFVYLMLPNGMDTRLITKLQQYSAQYTSRLLDLIGLGHHMDGTLIKVPGVQEYGIEQACSGVQSFFTLLLVSVVFIVLSRRISAPRAGWATLAVFLCVLFYLLKAFLFPEGLFGELLMVACFGLILFSFLGFRAAALILSAIFWAIFMNTIRIMVIPLSEYIFQYDLSTGMSHDVLGYVVLTIGILMLFSTDQFLFFLFGPVDSAGDDSGPLGNFITRVWNSVFSGESSSDDQRTRRITRQPISKAGRTLIWTCSGLMIAMGLWQLFDVQRSMAANEDIQVRFFDEDPTIEFEASDLPQKVGDWEQVAGKFKTHDRSRGSDLGQRSDEWRFQSNRVSAIFSIDQPFPGWHELTTCYKNVGWKLVERNPLVPSTIQGSDPTGDEWGYIEAIFEKDTGERAYLLFCHFDAFANGIPVPTEWATVNSFIIRARNRLSHRIRASLFQGEAYQVQVLLTSFNDFPDNVKRDAQLRFLELREQARSVFQQRKQSEQAKE